MNVAVYLFFTSETLNAEEFLSRRQESRVEAAHMAAESAATSAAASTVVSRKPSMSQPVRGFKTHHYLMLEQEAGG